MFFFFLFFSFFRTLSGRGCPPRCPTETCSGPLGEQRIGLMRRPSLIRSCMLLLHLAPARSAYTCHLPVPVRERSALSGVTMRRHRPCRAQSVARESVQEEEDGPSRPSRRSFQPSFPDPIPDSSSADSGHILGADSIPPVLDALRGGSFVLLAEDAAEDTTASLILAPQVSRAPLTQVGPLPPPGCLV